MYSHLSKYVILAVIQVYVFTNFVACGSDQYKKSLEDDIEFNSQDKNSIYYGIHSPKGWHSLPIPITIESRLNNEQEMQVLKAIATWEEAVGIQLFRYMGRDDGQGDDFLTLNESLKDGKNGNYLNYEWTDKTGKNKLILATTVWEKVGNKIKTADIRFNVEEYLLGDSLELEADDVREIVDLESLALHELGHLLGLDHIDADYDSLSVMNPTLYIGHGFTSRELSEGDVTRIKMIYNNENMALVDDQE